MLLGQVFQRPVRHIAVISQHRRVAGADVVEGAVLVKARDLGCFLFTLGHSVVEGGCPVPGNAFGVAVALVRPDEVHPAAQDRLITGDVQAVEKCSLVGADGVEVEQYAVIAGEQAGDHGRTGGDAQRASCVGVVQNRAGPGDAVQIGRADHGVTCVALDSMGMLV